MSKQVRTALAVLAGLLLIGAALAVGMASKSDASAQRQLRISENGSSEAFARHTEDLMAKVGEAGEGPASWADQNYALNGGDAIVAENISGAQAAFNAIQRRGIGQGKNSTASWYSLGPT